MDNEQQEHDELIRETGINAYAEAVAEMLADISNKHGDGIDPARIEMIKQGIARTMNPPRPRGFTILPGPPPMKCESNFRHQDDHGVTVYDWRWIAQRASHATRLTDGLVILYDGEEVYLKLSGPAAIAYWEWQEEAIRLSTWRPEHREEIG